MNFKYNSYITIGTLILVVTCAWHSGDFTIAEFMHTFTDDP